MAFPKKLILPAAAAAVVGLLLVAKSSKAATPPPGPPEPPLPPPPGPPLPPRPNPFPPGSALATVNPNSLGGMNVRTGPDVSFPLVSANDAFNGTTVAVLETGIPSTTPASKEWWKIITPGGSTGFASAVGPAGEANFRPTGNVPLPLKGGAKGIGPPVASVSGRGNGYGMYTPWAPQYGWRDAPTDLGWAPWVPPAWYRG